MKIFIWKFLCWAIPKLVFKCPECREWSFELKVHKKFYRPARPEFLRVCADCDPTDRRDPFLS